MAIDKKLLDFLKNHKFSKNEKIKYAELNNSGDTRTATDVTNQITTAFKNKNYKDMALIMEAVFDDGKGGTVSTLKNGSKTEFVYTNSKGDNSFFINLEIKNDSLIFTKGKKELTVEIELSTKVEKPANWNTMKNDIIEQLNNNKIKSLKEFQKFVEDYKYTKA